MTNLLFAGENIPSDRDLIKRASRTNIIPYLPIVGFKTVKTKSAIARHNAPIIDGSYDPVLTDILPDSGPTNMISRVGTSIIRPATSVV